MTDAPSEKVSGSLIPWTLLAGLAIVLGSEVMLLVDVTRRGGAIMPYEPLPVPVGALGHAARWTAVNMTPLCWVGYLLFMDGVLRAGGSPLRRRPVRALLCFLTGIPVWLFFDWANFSFMDAWRYHGLPRSLVHRNIGYFFAFGAISPAMFLAAEALLRLGIARLRARPFKPGTAVRVGMSILGAVMTVLPFVLRDPVANVTLWVGPLLLLEPINERLGAPSLLGDLRRGRPARLVALMAGGLACGLLWEFWNYWAAAKWTYHLPFLGTLEDVRYFEMPVLGLLGFLPFAPASWAAFHTILAALERLGIRAEPLPGESAL